jgi:hypothetical protein
VPSCVIGKILVCRSRKNVANHCPKRLSIRITSRRRGDSLKNPVLKQYGKNNVSERTVLLCLSKKTKANGYNANIRVVLYFSILLHYL